MDLGVAWNAYGPYVGSGSDSHVTWLALYPPSLGCLGFGGFGSPLPSGGIVTDVEARVTIQARQMVARSIIDGTSFKIVEMAVGSGGYDVGDATQAILIDPTVTALDNEIFRKPIDQIEFPTSLASRSFVCRFSADSFAGGVGELGLYAEILSSPNVAEIGTKFLFAIAHMGLTTKTNHHATSYRIIITF